MRMSHKLLQNFKQRQTFHDKRWWELGKNSLDRVAKEEIHDVLLDMWYTARD